MNKKNEYQDEGLKGNERIEDAIFALIHGARVVLPDKGYAPAVAGMFSIRCHKAVSRCRHLYTYVHAQASSSYSTSTVPSMSPITSGVRRLWSAS